MAWGGPIHGSWCGARTIPMRCRYCKTDVFYFSCEHGSEVLFDALGVPWPQHRHLDHLSYERLLELAGEDGLARFMEERMTTVRVDWRYGRWAQQAWTSLREQAEAIQEPRPPPREIVRQVPYPHLLAEEVGIVRELIENVDIHRRYGVGEQTLGEAALGDLARQNVTQVTVYTSVLGEEDDFCYTFFVERAKLTAEGTRIGDLVRCRLRGTAVLGHDPFWVCDHIELVA